MIVFVHLATMYLIVASVASFSASSMTLLTQNCACKYGSASLLMLVNPNHSETHSPRHWLSSNKWSRNQATARSFVRPLAHLLATRMNVSSMAVSPTCCSWTFVYWLRRRSESCNKSMKRTRSFFGSQDQIAQMIWRRRRGYIVCKFPQPNNINIALPATMRSNSLISFSFSSQLGNIRTRCPQDTLSHLNHDRNIRLCNLTFTSIHNMAITALIRESIGRRWAWSWNSQK